MKILSNAAVGYKSIREWKKDKELTALSTRYLIGLAPLFQNPAAIASTDSGVETLRARFPPVASPLRLCAFPAFGNSAEAAHSSSRSPPPFPALPDRARNPEKIPFR